jgi:curved DNA-binding protein CbpA
MALRRHPDKLVQSGLSQAEATAQFQELAHAYEVLSDPKERAWYDLHRSQILFSDLGNSVLPNSAVPNFFSFFSNTVFTGYSDLSISPSFFSFFFFLFSPHSGTCAVIFNRKSNVCLVEVSILRIHKPQVVIMRN